MARPETNEFKEVLSYEEGFDAIKYRLRDQLQQNGNSVILINGAGPNVGKTRLAGDIIKYCKTNQIPVATCPSTRDLSSSLLTEIQVQQHQHQTPQYVIIFDADGAMGKLNPAVYKLTDQLIQSKIRKAFHDFNLNPPPEPITVALSSPLCQFQSHPDDEPHTSQPYGEIQIFNQAAKQK